MKRIASRIAAIGIMLIAASPAFAQNAVEFFYRGKTISIIIPYPPGGSYDRYARIASEYMPKYIPGNPKIIVQNKSNLTGTLLDFSNNMADDGTFIGMFQETIGIEQLTDPTVARWDVRKLVYIGSFANVNQVFILRKDAPAKTVEDFKTVKTNVGCNSPNDSSHSKYALVKRLLGYQFNVICGYPGNTAFLTALQQGEIDLVVGAWNGWRDRPEVKEGGIFKPVIQTGLKRNKDLPDVPLIQDLMTDPAQKKVTEFWSAGAAIGRALVVRASVPAARIDALRSAFDKAMSDPELIAEAAKTNLEIDPTPGAEAQRVSDAILATPQEMIKQAIEAAK